MSDKQQHRKDVPPDVGLPDAGPEPSLAHAAYYLTMALGSPIPLGDPSPFDYARFAAEHIRAYRKSLGVEAKRQPSRKAVMTDEELLWCAMSHLCNIGLFHWKTTVDPVRHIRAAEADLLELLRRGQP